MERWKLFGLIIALACVLIFAPVSACHAYITKTGPREVCVDSDITYTITVTEVNPNNWYYKVVDYLPTGVTYISSSPTGTYDPVANTVTWTGRGDPTQPDPVMTVTVKPTSANTYKNSVKTWVKEKSGDTWGNRADFMYMVTTTAIPCYTTITKDAPERACVDCDLTYGIHVSYTGLNNQNVKVEDVLPLGVTFISASDSGTNNAGIVTWNFGSVNTGWSKDLTLVINPGSEGTLENTAESSVGGVPSKTTSNTVLTDIIICKPSPEFPTMVIPAAAITGMVLIMGYLKRKDF